MSEDLNRNDHLLPAWAVELTRQVAILNEKIPTHIDWVERNVKDHEVRLRRLETEQNKSSWLPKVASGIFGVAGGAVVMAIISAIINSPV